MLNINSKLHYLYDAYFAGWRDKRVHLPDHVIITGDMVRPALQKVLKSKS